MNVRELGNIRLIGATTQMMNRNQFTLLPPLKGVRPKFSTPLRIAAIPDLLELYICC